MAQTLKSKVLQHYDRMIAWAEKQKEPWGYAEMRREIGEAPIGLDCPLCRRYFAGGWCLHCPVFAATGRTGCDSTPYQERVVLAKTPQESCDALKAERAFLASLKYGRGVRK